MIIYIELSGIDIKRHNLQTSHSYQNSEESFVSSSPIISDVDLLLPKQLNDQASNDIVPHSSPPYTPICNTKIPLALNAIHLAYLLEQKLNRWNNWRNARIRKYLIVKQLWNGRTLWQTTMDATMAKLQTTFRGQGAEINFLDPPILHPSSFSPLLPLSRLLLPYSTQLIHRSWRTILQPHWH